MNLVGNLEDLPLSDILQIVHLARQTGRLEITHDGDMINLHFRQGKVVDASAPGSLARAFQLLQRRGLIDEDESLRLLHEQPQAEESWADRVLAAGLVSAPLLDQAREEWIRAEIASLLDLKSGEFVFRLQTEAAIQPVSAGGAEGVVPQSVTGQTLQFEFEKTASPSSLPTPVETPLVNAIVVQAAPPPVPPPKKFVTDSPMPAGPAEPLDLAGFQIGLALADLVIAESLHRMFTAAGAKVQRLPPEQIRDWLTRVTSPGVLVVDAMLPGAGRNLLGGIEIARMAENLRPAIPVITLVPPGLTNLGDHGLRNMMKRPDTAAIQLDQLESRLDKFSLAAGRLIVQLHPRDEMSDMAAALGAEPSAAMEVTDPMSMLRALIGELQTHGESEVSLLVLRLAAEYLERAVLVLVTGGELIGMGGFGATGLPEPMSVLVRRVRSPLAHLPELDAIIHSPRGHRGPLDPALQPFIAALGTLAPAEGVFLPLTSRNRIFAILYGDNAVSGRPIGDLLGLEIFVAQAGIAMENAMLEKQLAELKLKGA